MEEPYIATAWKLRDSCKMGPGFRREDEENIFWSQLGPGFLYVSESGGPGTASPALAASGFQLSRGMTEITRRTADFISTTAFCRYMTGAPRAPRRPASNLETSSAPGRSPLHWATSRAD